MRLVELDTLLALIRRRRSGVLTEHDLISFPYFELKAVRCKDCKQWGGVAFGNVCKRWSAPLAGMKNCTGPDDFCSYGERKDNDAQY